MGQMNRTWPAAILVGLVLAACGGTAATTTTPGGDTTTTAAEATTTTAGETTTTVAEGDAPTFIYITPNPIGINKFLELGQIGTDRVAV